MAEYKPYKDCDLTNPLLPTRIYGITENADQYLTVDAAVSVLHEASVDITRHPVEIGADISDYAIVNPRMFTIEGRISMVKPVKEASQNDANEVLPNSKYRVEAAWQVLEDAMRNRRSLYVLTPLKNYEDVLIKDLRVDQDAQTVRVLDFTATLQEIITVSVATGKLEADEIAEGARNKASQTNDLGTVQAVDDGSIPSRANILVNYE